jgi:Protein of unknown function (DUF1360)
MPTDVTAGYAPHEQRPLTSYAVLTAAFNAAVAGGGVALWRRGYRPPERYGFHDLLIFGAATHKLSRLIAKDKITSFARAPFTEYQGPAGPGELEESPRGTGLRYAVGELLVCPYCLGLWVSAALMLLLTFSPRLGRTLAFVAAAHAVADGLQIAYKAGEEHGL